MSVESDLVLLTASYPYGNKSETFLETEIEVVAPRFRRVWLLPSYREAGTRRLPDNVELVELDWLEEPPRSARWAALASPQAAAVMASMRGASPEMRKAVFDSRLYLDILARNVLRYRTLKRFVAEHRLAKAIFYDYWLENTTLALALLRRSGAIDLATARAHNFDIYDDLWSEGPVPFQDFKGKWLDRVFAISSHGAGYLRDHVPSLRGKLEVQRLGVRDPRRLPPPRTGEQPLVVSCSSMNPEKRVHLIPEVLGGVEGPLRWIHLGDGPERERVRAAAERLPVSVDWELRGHVDNQQVLHFYEQNHVDLFVSLSISEGIPVSMMEAQSYGIPITACGINGVPEIVTGQTGILLASEVSVDDARAAVQEALVEGRFDRDAVRSYFASNFNAQVNYNRFADALIALSQGQAQAA